MKKKLLAFLAFSALTAGSAMAAPVEVDVADPIAQVTQTASDVLPYVLAVVGAGIVFKLIRRWIH